MEKLTYSKDFLEQQDLKTLFCLIIGPTDIKLYLLVEESFWNIWNSTEFNLKVSIFQCAYFLYKDLET